MVIKNTTKKDITIKNAAMEDGSLIDLETGEVLNLTDVISKIYGDSEVKISITATTTEELDLPESDEE